MNLGRPKSHICLALDLPNKEDSFNTLEQCHDLISRYDIPIIADFKVADVPITNNRIARLARDAGADAIMVHGFIGAEGIMELKDAINNEIGIIIK